MTQDEIREAVLAALLDYETITKKRRFKAVKKALQGTMVATMIGSTGLMAAGQSRSTQGRETAAIMDTATNPIPGMMGLPVDESPIKIISGAAHFAVNQHQLTSEDELLLQRLVEQLPKGADLTVIGCTDSTGGQRYNKVLGTKRAQAVASYLEQHGVKVKKVANLISQNKHAGWLARRVDIVVDTTSIATAGNNLQPPVSNQSALQQAQPVPLEPATPMPQSALEYSQKKMEMPLPIENKVVSGDADVTENLPKMDDSVPITSTGYVVGQQQIQMIQGVTHYPLNGHALVTAHKDRLIELTKQLPKDAELTVIGRTDANGVQAYNKSLGMRRAKEVANFLAGLGVKIKAVGTKVSSSKASDWMARRVDIVVDSAQMPLNINLPPLAPQRESLGNENRGYPAKNHESSQIDGKRAIAIENNVTNLIQRARSVYNSNQANPGVGVAP